MTAAPRAHCAQRGGVLLVSVIVLASISVLTIGMLTNSYLSRTMAVNYKHKLQSFYASDGLMTYLAQEVIDGKGARYTGYTFGASGGTSKYEAEGASTNGSVLTSKTGFSGSGYVQLGDYVEYSVNAPGSGTYDLEFQYSVDDASMHRFEITKNGGTPILDNLIVSGTTWQPTSRIATFLDAGTNTIRMTKVKKGPYIDYLELGGAVSLLQPIFEMTFNEGTGSISRNYGTSGAQFASGALTSGMPSWSTNTAQFNGQLVGGTGSIDFGTSYTNRYAVDITTSTEFTPFSGLRSFTITGWINSRSNTIGAGGNRILNWCHGAAGGIDLVLLGGGDLQLGVNGWPDGSPAKSNMGRIPSDASAASSNWRFFAVTYDGTQITDNVKWYFGSPTVDASHDKTCSYNKGTVASVQERLTLGNFSTWFNGNDRMFRGLMDEIRVYGSNADASGALNHTAILGIQRGEGTRGPTDVWLSDINPDIATSGDGIWNPDLSHSGTALSAGGVTYAKGLGTMAGSVFQYDISSQGYTRFQATAGIDGPASGLVETQTYISDMVWVDSASGYSIPRRDRSTDNNALRIDGKTYVKGFSIHSYGDNTYAGFVKVNLAGGSYTRFISEVGLDDEVSGCGTVVLEVHNQSGIQATSPVMTDNTAGQHVFDLDVTGWTELTMKVYNAGDNIFCDHASWGNARLISTASAGGDLMAHWTFDDGSGTTIADASGNGNNATRTAGRSDGWTSGCPALQFSNSGALFFDACGTPVCNYASVADNPILDKPQTTGEVTIAVWYKPNNSWPQTYGITGRTNLALMQKEANRLAAIIGITTIETDSYTIVESVWQHLAVTYSRSDDQVKLYRNGVLLKTQTVVDATLSSNDPWYIHWAYGMANHLNNSNPATYDDLRVYARRLSGAEITALSSGFEPSANDGSGVYECEDATVASAIYRTDNLGWTGSGYRDFDGSSYVEWPVTVATAGTYRLRWRYATIYTTGMECAVHINGAIVAAAHPFAPTASWTTYQYTSYLTVSLSSGVNTIRITSGTTDGPNIDHMEVGIGAAPGSFDSWGYLCPVTLNTTSSGADVSGGVTDFPVIVRLSSSNWSGWGAVRNDGGDIRFAAPDGTGLSYEIERWDYGAQLAEIWVKVPSVLGNNSSQSITMFWGNPAASSEGDGSAVFDTSNGHWMALHLKEDGNVTTDGYGNATDYVQHATGYGLTSSSDIEGAVGKGQKLNGTNQYIRIANDGLPVNPPGGFSASMWLRRDATSTSEMTAMERAWDDYCFYVKTDNKLRYVTRDDTYVEYTSTQALTASQWYLASLSYTPADDSLRVYLDGTRLSSLKANWGGFSHGADDQVFFGCRANTTQWFNGAIDEIRIEKTARSAHWQKLCYQNQKPPSISSNRLVSLGTAQTNTPSGGTGGTPTPPPTTQPASVVFELWNENGRMAFSPLLTGSATHSFDVDISGWRTLKLVVTDGGDGNENDYVNWCNTKLGTAGAAATQIVFDAQSTIMGTTASTNVLHTVGSGDNRMLIVLTGMESDPPAQVQSVSCGSTPLVKAMRTVSAVGSGTENAAEIWYLANPPSGSQAITVSWDRSCEHEVAAVSLFNVKQGPPETVAGDFVLSGADIQVSAQVLTPGSWVVDALSNGNSNTPNAAASGQVKRCEVAGSSTVLAVSTRPVATPGVASMGWTVAGALRQTVSLAVFAPAGASGGGLTTSTLYQAEDASFIAGGGTLRSDVADAVGSGCVEYGNYIEWNVLAPAAGSYDLSFRFKYEDFLPRWFALSGNAGAVLEDSLLLQSNNWIQSTQVAATLSEGLNTIRLTKLGDPPGPNVDFLLLSSRANMGTITMEVWDGIGGTAVGDLTAATAYPLSPTRSKDTTVFGCSGWNVENYGVRWRGYVHPPTTGDYQFYVRADDNAQLFLSSSEDPAAKVQIASETSWRSDWPQPPDESVSQPIALEAGRRYYVEFLHKGGGGGNQGEVGWSGPGGLNEKPIQGSYLSPWGSLFTEMVPDTVRIGECDVTYSVSGTNLAFNIKTLGYKMVGGILGAKAAYPTPLEQYIELAQAGGVIISTTPTVRVPVTFYDFRADGSNPEFECDHQGRLRFGMVGNTLDSDRKPVVGPVPYLNCYMERWFRPWDPDFRGINTKPNYVKTGGVSYDATHAPYTCPASINVGHDTAFMNYVISDTLTFVHVGAGQYEFYEEAGNPPGSPGFFRLDGRGLGNDGLWHNFAFTMEIKSRFVYQPGLTFYFQGDDDVWVFINNKLALDLGGIHSRETGSFALDPLAASLGLVVGEEYNFDFFYCERHTSQANIRVTTNISMSGNESTHSRHWKRDYGQLD